MITQLIIKKDVYGLYMGWPYIPLLYSTYYKGQITTGKTASESINKMLETIYK